MTQGVGYLYQCFSVMLAHPTLAISLEYLIISENDKLFSEAGKLERLSYYVLAMFSSCFFLYPVCSDWTVCLQSAIEARAVFFLHNRSILAGGKWYIWNVFGANHTLRSRLVLPKAVVPHVNRILSY